MVSHGLPSARCYLELGRNSPVLARVVIASSGKESTWIRDSEHGAKTIKSFCIGLLWAKFRSNFDLNNPGWEELARVEGSTWAKTISENLCPSKRKHSAWWSKGIEDICPDKQFPFRLREKPQNNLFRVEYSTTDSSGVSCWAIERLQLFNNEKLVQGSQLLEIAQKLERSEPDWTPVLPDDEDVASWPIRITRTHARMGNASALDNLEVFGREWVFGKLAVFMAQPAQNEGRYLLLTADPFYGKSAIAAEVIRRIPQLGAYFFIQRGRGDCDDAKVILDSLVTQLREKYGLECTDDSRGRNIEALFFDTIRQVSDSLATGQQSLIVVDGLDEAFGLGCRISNVKLGEAFPKQLPPGIKILFTSRDGEHLSALCGSESVQTIPLGAFQKENRRDILSYLRHQSVTRKLKLADTFIEQLADSAEGSLGVAAWLVRPREEMHAEFASWKVGPKEIPHGLGGLLQQVWSTLVKEARKESIQEGDCRRLLGLLAFAMREITWSELREILLSAIENHSEATTSLSPNDAFRVFRPVQLLEQGERILELSTQLFANHRSPSGFLTFFHSSVADFIKEAIRHANEDEYCRIMLVHACSKWFRPALRDYAVQNRIPHTYSLFSWARPFLELIADCDFIERRFQSKGSQEIYRELGKSFHLAYDQGWGLSWHLDFSLWHEFILNRCGWPDFIRCYRQEILNEIVNERGHADPGDRLPKVFGKVDMSQGWVLPFFLKKTFGPPIDASEGHETTETKIANMKKQRLIRIEDDAQTTPNFVVNKIPFEQCLQTFYPLEDVGLKPELYLKGCVARSSDGRFVAAGHDCSDGQHSSVTVWDVSSGQTNAIFVKSQVLKVEFVNDKHLELAIEDAEGIKWKYAILSVGEMELPIGESAASLHHGKPK